MNTKMYIVWVVTFGLAQLAIFVLDLGILVDLLIGAIVMLTLLAGKYGYSDDKQKRKNSEVEAETDESYIRRLTDEALDEALENGLAMIEAMKIKSGGWHE